jgi:hypothetical protein
VAKVSGVELRAVSGATIFHQIRLLAHSCVKSRLPPVNMGEPIPTLLPTIFLSSLSLSPWKNQPPVLGLLPPPYGEHGPGYAHLHNLYTTFGLLEEREM